MSRRKRNRSKNKPSPMDSVSAAQRIDQLLRGVKPEIVAAGGNIKHPVYVYLDGQWVVVEKNSTRFPLPLLQDITPEFALDVLANRNEKNRKKDPRRVKKYAHDIFNKNWHIINNGLGFYEDGTLADGQHRLEAVLQTEKTVPMIVVYGVSPEAVMAIDEGRPRSNTDVGRMLGMKVSNSAMSAANYMLEVHNAKEGMSRTEILEFYGRHEEAVTSVLGMFGTKVKGVMIAPVTAVLARAWYTCDRDRLREFAEILTGAIPKDETDSAAYVLRTYLITKMDWNTGPARAEKYRKIEAALVHFLNRAPISRIYGMNDEQFPIPETICAVN